MKYFALALALSSFTFVGCSKKKHICDDMVAKLEECHAKATGDNKTQVAALVKELKDGLKEEGYTADNEKECQTFLNDTQGMAVMFDNLCK